MQFLLLSILALTSLAFPLKQDYEIDDFAILTRNVQAFDNSLAILKREFGSFVYEDKLFLAVRGLDEEEDLDLLLARAHPATPILARRPGSQNTLTPDNIRQVHTALKSFKQRDPSTRTTKDKIDAHKARENRRDRKMP